MHETWSDILVTAYTDPSWTPLFVAIKGLGGFHLACDATNQAAVSELRLRKLRVDKPFALMMADKETIDLAHLPDEVRSTSSVVPVQSVEAGRFSTDPNWTLEELEKLIERLDSPPSHAETVGV